MGAEIKKDNSKFGKILVVEDEPMLREMIFEEFKEEGFDVTAAADGKEGLKLFLSSGPFSFVVTDIRMPNMSGDEFQRKVASEQPDLRKQSKWIALSAYIPGEVPGFNEADFNVVFFKPISFRLLLNWIRSQSVLDK